MQPPELSRDRRSAAPKATGGGGDHLAPLHLQCAGIQGANGPLGRTGCAEREALLRVGRLACVRPPALPHGLSRGRRFVVGQKLQCLGQAPPRGIVAFAQAEQEVLASQD